MLYNTNYISHNNFKIFDKYQVLYNSIILSIISASLIISVKSINIYSNINFSFNINYGAITILLANILLCIEWYYFRFKLNNKNIFTNILNSLLLCCIINIILLYLLLSTNTPDTEAAQLYYISYKQTYNFKRFILVLFCCFTPSYLLDYFFSKYKNNTNIKYKFNFYIIISLLCVILLINSHSICYKFIDLYFFGTVAASGVMFSFTFLLADVVVEHYGYSYSRNLIWSVLLSQFIFVSIIYLVYLLPSSDIYNNQYFNILYKNLYPRQIVAASFCVFFAFFSFSFLISVLKINLYNKKFWFRTIVSNIVAKAVLCTFSYIILFYGKYNWIYIIKIIISTWILKMLIAIVGTFLITVPLIYYLRLNDRKIFSYNNTKYNLFMNYQNN